MIYEETAVSREMDRFNREAAAQYGPAPTTPTEALTHVLCALGNLPDDHMVVKVTDGIYGKGVRTGLTMGDLRALQDMVDARARHNGPGLPASDLPGWAVTQLADRGIDPGEISHFIGNPAGQHLIVAVDGKPVPLTKD